MNLGTLAHILCWIRDLVVWKTKLNLTVSGSDWLCCMANITYFSKYWIKDSTIPSSLSRLLWQLVKFNWRILKERFYINAKESRNVLVMCAHRVTAQHGVWGRAAGVGPPGRSMLCRQRCSVFDAGLREVWHQWPVVLCVAITSQSLLITVWPMISVCHCFGKTGNVPRLSTNVLCIWKGFLTKKQ